jgi:hypothetical protein
MEPEVRISFAKLREYAEDRWPNPIETSLLGKVQALVVDGKWVGEIPDWVRDGARQHGLEVIVADFRLSSYSFRLLQPPNAPKHGRWRAVNDGDSHGMLKSPDGRVFRLQQLGAGASMWGTPDDNDNILKGIVTAMNALGGMLWKP